MSLNRKQLRDAVLQYADATGSGRWDRTAGGEVDLRVSSVFDRLWRRILNANRFYRTAQRTPTADATGRYALADLTLANQGDQSERLYRILTIYRDGIKYDGPEPLTNFAGALLDSAHATGAQHLWMQDGANLILLPLEPNRVMDPTVDGIWVNWIPQRPAQLESDDSAVDFPEGYEEVLIVHGAARLLMKGGAETQASLDLRASVQEDFEEMLQDVARVSTNPQRVQYGDSAGEWAG